MWLLHPLEDILSSPAKVAILRALCRTRGPLSGRETIRRAGTTYGPGWDALQDLVASGVLIKRDLGRASAYELREPESPLILRLRELFDAEEERREQVVGELTAEIDDALTIILYGSEARGEAEAGSDTDVLIVIERRSDEIADRIDQTCLEIAEKYSLALSWHIADLDDLREWEESESDFWQNILADGVRLAGEPIERVRRRWQTGRVS